MADRSSSQLSIGPDILNDLAKALNLEWIITNGLGGYASSSVLGTNTRKYHGVLVASFNPPVDRRVVLSKLDERLFADGETYCFGVNEFNKGMTSGNPKYLESFSRFPFPTYTYSTSKAKIEKTIVMPYQKNAIVISYRVKPSFKEKATLRITPLVNSRHFHSVTRRAEGLKFVCEASPQRVTIETGEPKSILIISSNSGRFILEEKWVNDFFFRVDSSLGTSSLDDCYSPGEFKIDLDPGRETRYQIVVAAGEKIDSTLTVHSTMQSACADFSSYLKKETGRLRNLQTKFAETHPNIALEDWLRWLIVAADSFIVTRGSTKTKTVIAGYHWFEDWGRDSLISLPGLTLVTGRFDAAKEILQTFNQYCLRGIIPNRFPDQDGRKPVYNTVDATLWFFNATLQYLKYTGDFDFVKEKLWTTMQSVIEHHIQGTINDIQLDNDGLIMHGPQLTWMDAIIDGNPVTSREGKAVEIQTLWFNALKIMELLAARFGSNHAAREYHSRAEVARKGFVEKFWNSEKNCLFDVINGEEKDASIRPNQILSVALDFSMLDPEKQSSIVAVVHEKLWAVYGLRTLSTDDSKYQGIYTGGWNARNYAYHNGTVWSWLVGPFVTSFLKIRNFNFNARKFAFKSFLEPLFSEQMLQAGLGTVSEIFDGDPPHLPRGCISQAWSVAEPLRAYVEDISLSRPRYERSIMGEFCERECKEGKSDITRRNN
ncbi:glycogen debranching protein [Candidatus Bathyarchaeota archaeon]|nr:MAG: glycogen debranching protein [Candidatus Bathyarchaeota archaeon]